MNKISFHCCTYKRMNTATFTKSAPRGVPTTNTTQYDLIRARADAQFARFIVVYTTASASWVPGLSTHIQLTASTKRLSV